MYVIRNITKDDIEEFKKLAKSKNMSDGQLIRFLVNYYYEVEAAML